MKWKTNIKPLENSLDQVMKLPGVSFDWGAEEYKDMHFESGKEIGLIAQEVEKVLPELVAYGKDGKPETVKYQVLPTLLLGELEKQERRLAGKDAEIAALRREEDAKVAALAEEVRRLVARLEAVERAARH